MKAPEYTLAQIVMAEPSDELRLERREQDKIVQDRLTMLTVYGKEMEIFIATVNRLNQDRDDDGYGYGIMIESVHWTTSLQSNMTVYVRAHETADLFDLGMRYHAALERAKK